MTKTILAAVPLAVLALAAPASARDGRDATTYRATLAPVTAEAPPAEEPTASATKRHRGSVRAKGLRGAAELRDRSRRDRVDLRIRGLQAGTAYRWEVRKAAEGEDACNGETVGELVYSELNTRRRGGGKARAFSRTFAVESGAVYAVVVSTTEAVDVACGVFKSKAELKREKAEKKAGKNKGEKKYGSEDDESNEDAEESDESDDVDPVDEDDSEDEDELDESDQD